MGRMRWRALEGDPGLFFCISSARGSGDIMDFMAMCPGVRDGGGGYDGDMIGLLNSASSRWDEYGVCAGDREGICAGERP